jgi:CRP/FNR family transcriptional regulator, cyclic AMP receptor protein
MFTAQSFLDSPGTAKTVIQAGRNETIFIQGDSSDHVMYIRSGGVKLSVLSKAGKEAVVAMLGPGGFFGEACLAGQRFRTGTATAITPSVIVRIRKEKMLRLLHRQHAMSDRFISHLLGRSTRMEEDLIDQLFTSSEKRLARTLLRLARYGRHGKPAGVVRRISEEQLAKMAGTTPSQANFFLKKFRKLGFIELSGELPLKIRSSLLSVVLQD